MSHAVFTQSLTKVSQETRAIKLPFHRDGIAS